MIKKKKLEKFDNNLIAMKNGYISCTLENLCNRFPHLSERILVHLNDRNFVKIKDSSKKLNNFIKSNRRYFLRIINKYTERLDKQSWTKVVTKTTTGLIKKLAFDLVEFFNLPCVCCHERPIDYMRFDGPSASRHNWHPLHVAAKLGYSELYEYISAKTGDFNPVTSFGVSSLHLAADAGNFQICKFIIKNLEDRYLPHLQDENGWTPLHFAADNGSIKVYKLILDNTAFKNPKNKYGSSPLHSAARGGHFELFKFIIEKLENKNPTDNDEFTIFHHAAFSGNLELCKYLMELPYAKNFMNFYGETPLHCAAHNGHVEVCKLIMENLTDKNPKGNDGDTPLHLAAMQGHFEVCKFIMKHLTDKNPKGESGDTLLHIAADFGYLRLFKLIMEHATDKNPKNDHGDTPLHCTAYGDPQEVGSTASSREQLEICQYIVENVTDIDPANVDGKTPLDYAQIHKSQDVVELLKAKRKKTNMYIPQKSLL